MFNSTHTLVGLCLAQGGLNRVAPQAMWTAVIAANLPDVDIVSELNGMASYITLHRGITHSLVGIPLLSLGLAALMHWASGKFLAHFAVALISMTTHPLLDFANTYGIRPLLPLSSEWFYGDILFVIDPYLDLALLSGLVIGRYWKGRREFLAVCSLALMCSYMFARIELRNIARDRLQMFSSNILGYERSAVLPRMLTPFVWTGVVETKDALSSFDVDVFGGVGPELVRIEKSPETPAVAVASQTHTAASLLRFARFPVARVRSTPTGYHVAFIDFRFYRESSNTALAALVELNLSLRLVGEKIGFNQQLN